jgi:hypothetical protein
VSERISPFALVFGEIAEERFPALKASLAAGRVDATDRDAFVLDRAVTEFLRDLVPEDAPPESLHEFIAVLQHSYLFWAGGQKTRISENTELPRAPRSPRAPSSPHFVGLPSHLYWGQPDPDGSHEPVDGFFIHPFADGIRVLAIFGLHRERPGFSVAEVAGAPPELLLPRADGSSPFAPQMDGGAAAGIRSVAGADELLALAWHALSTAS